MAGNPLKRKWKKDLEAFGGIPAVLDLVRDGKSLTAISKILNDSGGYHRHLLSDEVNKPQWKLAYEAAKAGSAEALSDMVQDAAETVTPENANAVRIQAELRRWLAGVHDREKYGTSGGSSAVTVNIHQNALDALRKRSMPAETVVDITPQIEAAGEIESED